MITLRFSRQSHQRPDGLLRGVLLGVAMPESRAAFDITAGVAGAYISAFSNG